MEGVPPFMLFFDAALREMADARPGSMEALLQIKGVGTAKAQKYGRDVLRVIADAAGEATSDARGSAPAPEAAQAQPADADRPSHVVSWDMFGEGASIREIAAERGMSAVTIEGHVLRCAEEGLPLDWSRILTEEQEALIVQAASEVGEDKLRPIKDVLPDGIDYFMIKAALVRRKLAAANGE